MKLLIRLFWLKRLSVLIRHFLFNLVTKAYKRLPIVSKSVKYNFWWCFISQRIFFSAFEASRITNKCEKNKFEALLSPEVEALIGQLDNTKAQLNKVTQEKLENDDIIKQLKSGKTLNTYRSQAIHGNRIMIIWL